MAVDPTVALLALESVDFNWTSHVKSIWDAPPFDLAQLHQAERAHILRAVSQLQANDKVKSPLGQVIIGPPGVGKTHFLAAIRQQVIAQDLGFILVDMTDVRNFWETVLQGYISSLREDSEDAGSQFQLRRIVKHLIDLTGHQNVSAAQMAGLSASALKKGMVAVLKAIYQKNPQATSRYQDIIRALLLLNSDDFVCSDIGYSWLSGLSIEAADKQQFGFRIAVQPNLRAIVEGLSWVLSLHSPWVLALDQLDSIVAQHHYAATAAQGSEPSEEKLVSKSIIEGIGGGLMALHDKTLRTLTILSCLDVTWEILTHHVVSSFKGRFRQAIGLMVINQPDLASQLIAPRVQIAYQQHQVVPPYPTWPFHPDFFVEAAQRGKPPREILQRCEQHRQACLAQENITELHAFTDTGPILNEGKDLTQLDQTFQSVKQNLDLSQALTESHEDDILGQWLQTLGDCLVRENPTTDNIDAATDIYFPGGKNYPQLHVRVRLTYRDQGDREKHLCLRALQRLHHAAYKTRLRTAMTTAGIDRALSFRRLMIVRTYNIPGGATVQQLTQQFSQAGGLFAHPTHDELLVIGGLHQLKAQNLPNFDGWLRQRRPVSQLPFMQETVTWLFGAAVSGAPPTVNPPQNGNSPTPPKPGNPPELTSRTGLPIGKRFLGTQIGAPVSIPLEALSKHTVILAGSGAGKTVLVRRLVEEAALQGIPAIVIDGANDLARMGDAWPSAPEAWTAEDGQKAERYHRTTEVTIWTPGREIGNAVNLNPLPDFSALSTSADELEQAIDMARDSLQDIVAPGKAVASKIKRGILRNALAYFAKMGDNNLGRFAEFLTEMPDEAASNFANAAKHAQQMADLLNAEIANNPLLRQSGAPLDPAILLGLDRSSPTVRLSILNFIGLPGIDQQQVFLNQLAMTLFTWIKKNPAPPEQPLRGLLVIDEAKDFLPAQQSTPCKSSLNRLAAQARKYGLGLIFATQAPKSIDHNIIANCSTQFYGRANSPAAINVVQEQLRQRGGDGQDIARLSKGQFYAVSESLTPPIKILTPLCLSYHPSSPLDESEVLARAVRSRLQ